MTETVPKQYIPYAVSFVLILDQVVNQIVPTAYFVFVSINWYPLYVGLLIVFSLPQVFMVWYLPESPTIYYEEGDFELAKEVIY